MQIKPTSATNDNCQVDIVDLRKSTPGSDSNTKENAWLFPSLMLNLVLPLMVVYMAVRMVWKKKLRSIARQPQTTYKYWWNKPEFKFLPEAAQRCSVWIIFLSPLVCVLIAGSAMEECPRSSHFGLYTVVARQLSAVAHGHRWMHPG